MPARATICVNGLSPPPPPPATQFVIYQAERQGAVHMCTLPPPPPPPPPPHTNTHNAHTCMHVHTHIHTHTHVTDAHTHTCDGHTYIHTHTPSGMSGRLNAPLWCSRRNWVQVTLVRSGLVSGMELLLLPLKH